jgi:rhodanese-related sulfurtransferase
MKIFGVLSGFFLSLTSWGQVQSRAFKATIDALNNESVPYISVAELRRTPGVVLLDTRQQREYLVSHLKGARWVGYDEFELSAVRDLPKDAPIVVYCSVGYRSERVGEKLLAAGYRNVRNLYGSIFEWVNQGYPVVGPDGQPTTRVHAYNRAWGVWLKRGEKVYE